MKTQRINLLFAALLTGGIMSCSAPASKQNEAIEKNKQAMLKVNEAFAAGNADLLDTYVAENMIDHNPDPMIKTTGLQALKDMVKMYHAAFPDMKMTTINIIGEGDLVVYNYNMKGTNSGAMGEMPATNKSIDVNGVDIVRFENGKGVEHWGYWEESKMMTQLGLMPAPGGAPADTTKKM